MFSYWKLRTEDLDAAHSQRVKSTCLCLRVLPATVYFPRIILARSGKAPFKGAIVTM